MIHHTLMIMLLWNGSQVPWAGILLPSAMVRGDTELFSPVWLEFVATFAIPKRLSEWRTAYSCRVSLSCICFLPSVSCPYSLGSSPEKLLAHKFLFQYLLVSKLNQRWKHVSTSPSELYGHPVSPFSTVVGSTEGSREGSSFVTPWLWGLLAVLGVPWLAAAQTRLCPCSHGSLLRVPPHLYTAFFRMWLWSFIVFSIFLFSTF